MYEAYITELHGLRKHSNADRLQCVTVFGNNVIVDMSYYEGQRVVYFPTDGQLSLEFAEDNNLVRKKDENGNSVGGYLDPNKRNITAIRLRGEQSDGLVLPIETLNKYVDINKLKSGDTISILGGHEICKKYIPNRNRNCQNTSRQLNATKSEPKVTTTYPYFAEHEDTKQLAYNQAAFRPGDICTITLKVHGTSQRTANTSKVIKHSANKILKKLFHLKDRVLVDYDVVSGTRRTTLKSFDDGGYYNDNAFRKPYHDMFSSKLPKGVEVFYEVVGYVNETTPIMAKCNNKLIKDNGFSKMYGKETTFSYGCLPGKNKCFVYRMTMTNPDGFVVEIPWSQVQIICEKMGVECVPTFETFVYTTWEDLMSRVEKYYDGPDPIDNTHVREGIVIRIENREKFTAFKHKNFSFKCLEGICKDTSGVPDMEEAEELIHE